MIKKILIANRGESGLQAASVQPNSLVCAAHAGEFPAESRHV